MVYLYVVHMNIESGYLPSDHDPREKEASIVSDKNFLEIFHGMEQDIVAEALNAFDENSEPLDRINEMEVLVRWFCTDLDEEIFPESSVSAVLSEIRSVGKASDRYGFAKGMARAFHTYLEARDRHPVEFEEAEAKRMNESSGFTALNRLVSYQKKGDTIHLHNVPGKTVPNKKGLYLDALRKLAVIVDADKDVERVVATSWVVGEHQRLFELAGFSIQEAPSEIVDRFFSGSSQRIMTAAIGRDAFLKRYLET